MRPRVRISRVSTVIVDADDRDWLAERVEDAVVPHPGRSPRPHLRFFAPDGGLIE
jgi:hypothetical protein